MPEPEMRDVPDGPCGPWPVDPRCCPDWPEEPDEWDERHEEAVMVATDILWRLTAGRYGLCEEWIRPCRPGCWPSGGFPPGYGFPWAGSGSILHPYQDRYGRWFNAGCGCGSDCSCTSLCALRLDGPVHAVVEVRVDGEVVSPDSYWLDKSRGELIKREGECWPSCQDLTRPDCEPGTFSVRYLRGKPVPPAGVRAVSALACEVFKECNGRNGCLLPAGVKTIQREGVTYDILPPGDWMGTLKMNLPVAYRWVNLVNPHGLKQPSAVYSLDLPPAPRGVRRGPVRGL